MTLPGDVARASVLVRVPTDVAFRTFTEEIDAWWQRGLRYRIGKEASVLHIEPFVGGRLFESFDLPRGPTTKQTGTVTAWEPPARLAFEWRGVNFRADEKTLVEVTFEPRTSGTMVTVTHSGFASLRADHPVRHGLPVPDFIRMMAMWWGDLLTSLREHTL